MKCPPSPGAVIEQTRDLLVSALGKNLPDAGHIDAYEALARRGTSWAEVFGLSPEALRPAIRKPLPAYLCLGPPPDTCSPRRARSGQPHTL
jgi:hypothetical protein